MEGRNGEPPRMDDGHVDDILRAAFGDEPEPGESILDSIERISGEVPRVLLRDVPEDASPVLRIHGAESRDLVRDERRYRVLGEIARGGVGVVFKSRDRNLGRHVALKVLRPEHLGNEEIVQRFVEEAQIGGQLQHPGIVPVYGLGISEEKRPYFAMKLVKGETLAALLEVRKGPAEDRPRLLSIFEQIAQTMAYAHARGVIHRDLKPSNVMLGAFGEVQIVDWGLSKVLGQEERPRPDVTMVSTVRTEGEGSASLIGSVMGTPAYMSPEQAMGKVEELDERSDVFSLGAILAEILTGLPPYTGETRDQLMMAMHGRLEEAEERLGECEADEELKALCLRCLAPVPKERPKDAGVVAAELSAHLAEVEERARREELSAAGEKARAAEQRRREARARVRATAERKARRRTLALAAVILLAVAAGGGGYLVKDREDRHRTGEAATAVSAALEEAARHESDSDWPGATAAAKKAVALAESKGADEATAATAQATLARIERAHAEAAERTRLEAEDTALVAKLSEIRLRRGEDLDAKRTDREYAETFRELGIHPDDLDPEAAAAAIRARTRPVEIAAALDDWAWIRRSRLEQPKEEWSLLVEAAMRADPDPWRDRLRIAVADGNIDQLRGLAEEADPDGLPARTLDLLGTVLAGEDPEAGIALLRRARTAHPGDLWLNFHLAYHLYRSRSPSVSEALRYGTAALALLPDSAHIWNLLGAVHGRLGQKRPAVACYLRAAACPSASLVPLTNAASLLLTLREPEAAHAACLDARQRAPESGLVHCLLAQALLALGRKEEAEGAYAQALTLEPDSPDVLRLWGAHLCDHLGDFAEAERVFRRAVKLAPEDVSCWANLGISLMRQDRLDEAEECLRKATEVGPNHAGAHDILASVLRRQGKTDEAEAVYQRALALDPRSAIIRANWGHFLLTERGDGARAEAEVRRAIELDPGLAVAHRHLAQILAARGELESAEAALRQAAALAQDSGVIQHSLGAFLYNNLHDYAGAEAAFREAVRLNPRGPRAQGDLVLALLRQEKLAEAEAAARSAIAVLPRNATLRDCLGDILWQLRRREEALESVRTAARLEPGSSRRCGWLGWAMHAYGDLEASVRFSREAIELGVEQPGLVYGTLSLALDRLGRFREALDTIRKLLKIAPDNAWSWRVLGGLLDEAGDAEGAENAYRRAVELEPGSAVGRFVLAQALLALGRTEDALEEARKAVELDPGEPFAHYTLGEVLHAADQLEEARGALRKAIAGQREAAVPDDAGRMWGLAFLLSDCPDPSMREPAEAVRLMRTAMSISPQDAIFPLRLGVALYRAGEYAEAVERLQTIAESWEGQRTRARARFFLAMARWRLGEREKAGELLRLAKEWIDTHVSRDPIFGRLRREAEALMAGKGE